MNLDQITLKEADSGRNGASEEGGGEAALTLHSAHLGAIEVRIRLDASGVRATVATPPGRVTARAATTLPDLVAALERATRRTGIANVQARRGSQPGPTPPEGAYDGAPERVPDVVSPPPAAAAVPVTIAAAAPPELYEAFAEALAWAYRLTGGEPPV
ncbi:MAG: flagellar hook-length control protein FliK [Gaiellales bacterium]